MSTDAIVMLREDHQELKRVFREFEAAGENAVAKTESSKQTNKSKAVKKDKK